MNATRVGAALLLVSALFSISPATAVAASYTQIENAKPGTTEWKLVTRGFASSAIEGYASLTSVNRGGQIRLFVNTAESLDASFHIGAGRDTYVLRPGR